MSIALHGLCASKGIAIGRLHVVDRGQLEVSEYALLPQHVDAEVERLVSAVRLARSQLRGIRDQIPGDVAEDIVSFIDTHLLMLEDSALTRVPMELIRDRRCNAEWALKIQRDTLVSLFEEMEDPYLRTRKDDVEHVVARIQRILLKQNGAREERPDRQLHGAVVLAHDLTPEDTVLLRQQGIVGFVTEYGGPTSHAAILARSLRIPSIVGMHQARAYLREDDEVIIDGRAGILLVDPDPRTVEHYQALQKAIGHHHSARKRLRGTPTRTRDGQDIRLDANIELPEDVAVVKGVRADGVGLFRTEFLFMNRDAPPDEEEQLAVYTSVVQSLDGAPVTIRTLDIGADKPLASGPTGAPAINPAMGLRAIRLCMQELSLFRPQLRAILRASAHGPVRLMVPMISSLSELRQVRDLIGECRATLSREGLAFDAKLPIGAMIEVPAAAICADLFAPHLDFLSIGTNDLIQYSLAIDRVDDEVNYLYDPLHPAVLRLIHMVLEAGRQTETPVSMCGEMAANSSYTRLLLGLGLTEFSVPPNALLEIKQVINDSDTGELSEPTLALMKTGEPATREALLERINGHLH